MNSSSEDIKDMLESSSCAIADFGTDLFIGFMPDSPDLCICLYDTGGEPQEHDIETPHLMVKVRGNPGGYVEAYAKIKGIKDFLHGKGGFSINGTKYVGIWSISSILSIGNDEKKRPRLSTNFRIQRSE